MNSNDDDLYRLCLILVVLIGIVISVCSFQTDTQSISCRSVASEDIFEPFTGLVDEVHVVLAVNIPRPVAVESKRSEFIDSRYYFQLHQRFYKLLQPPRHMAVNRRAGELRC